MFVVVFALTFVAVADSVMLRLGYPTAIKLYDEAVPCPGYYYDFGFYRYIYILFCVVKLKILKLTNTIFFSVLSVTDNIKKQLSIHIFLKKSKY